MKYIHRHVKTEIAGVLMKNILRRANAAMVLVAGCLLANHGSAQDDFTFWPDADYDPAIPTV